MTETEFNITPTGDKLDIRRGSLPAPIEPQGYEICGGIHAPAEYARVVELGNQKTTVEVDTEGHKITLVADRGLPTEVTITGSLTYRREMKAWGINTDKAWQPRELAKHVRMHRAQFTREAAATELAVALKNIEMKIDQQIEAKDDDRGNAKALVERTVSSNIPESFTLTIQPFKEDTSEGQPAKFEAEVFLLFDVESRSFKIKLESIDVYELEQTLAEALLNEAVAPLAEQGFAVMYL